MRADRFIRIAGWMMDDLGLKGNELLIYALIHGFSQEAQGAYTGSQKELAEWVHTGRTRCAATLDTLTERGLLVKESYTDAKGVARCMYRAVDPMSQNGTCPKTGQRLSQNETRDLSQNGTIPLTEDIYRNNTEYTHSTACVRTREELVSDLKKEFRAMVDGHAGEYTPEMLDAFCDYWTEPYTNPTGTKLVRWQGERTWDTAARLRTWAGREKAFAPKARAYERPKLRPVIDTTIDFSDRNRALGYDRLEEEGLL